MNKSKKFWFITVPLSMIVGATGTRFTRKILNERQVRNMAKVRAHKSSLISENLKTVRDRTDARIAEMDNPTSFDRERVWNEEYERFFHPNS